VFGTPRADKSLSFNTQRPGPSVIVKDRESWPFNGV
jgi:hypothetical protein